jgi:hypothetical protein
MRKFIPHRERVRFVLMKGKLLRLPDKNWMFMASPMVEVPIRELVAPTRWTCIDTVYELIKGYGSQHL